MNIHSELHKSLSHSFLRYGIIILAVIGGIFFYKDRTGYTTVTKVTTIQNCRVTTSEAQEPFRTNKTYFLSVFTREEETTDEEDTVSEEHDNNKNTLSVKSVQNETLIFECVAPQAFVKHFVNYDNDFLTIYRAEDGKEFPVYTADADETEAEREYRKIRVPYIWYTLYIVGAALGIFCLYHSIRLAKVAANYKNENYEFIPDPMSSAGEKGAMAMLKYAKDISADKSSNAEVLSSFLNKDVNDIYRYDRTWRDRR